MLENRSTKNSKVEISGFRREVDENSALLGYYGENSGNSLAMFRDNLSAPSSRINNRFLTLEDGTDRLSRNVANELPRRAQLSTQKSPSVRMGVAPADSNTQPTPK
jgi:hypothetical protein